MVEIIMSEYEEKYIKKRNLTMNVLPQFQQLFSEVHEVSSKHLYP